MTLSVNMQSVMAGSGIGSPMSPVAMSASPRGGLAGSHTRLYKQKRRPSNASTASNNSPAIAQFPTFDPTFERTQATTYYNMAPQEPMPLFKQSRGDSFGQENHGSSFGKKIKPLVRYTGNTGKEQKPLDLNLSKAENEERGAYLADSPPVTADSTQTHGHMNMHSAHSPYPAGRTHSRTLSGASQISSSSAHSNNRMGTTYVHPARQAAQSPTPPVLTTPFEPPGVLRTASSHGSLTNVPSFPPTSHFRSSNLSALRSQTSTPTHTSPSTPALVPSAPATARSSIDSAFRDRVSFSTTRKSSRRPSRNKEPMDIEEEQMEIIRLRQKWAERQHKKDEKYRLEEERKAQEEEKKVRRKSEAAESARNKRSQLARRRGDSDGTMDTVRTLDTDIGAAVTPKRSHPNTRRGSNAVRGSAEQLSAIGYASTAELQRPNMGTISGPGGVDGAEDNAEKVKIPKRQKTQGAASAGKAAQSRWSLFWFQFKTMLLKVFRK